MLAVLDMIVLQCFKVFPSLSSRFLTLCTSHLYWTNNKQALEVKQQHAGRLGSLQRDEVNVEETNTTAAG